MKRTLTLLAALTLLVSMGAFAQSRVRAGVSFGDGRLTGFYIGLTDEYRVPSDRVRYLYEAGVPEEDMPDILFIYTHSNYSLSHIVNLRQRGATWFELYTWCGIPQNIAYVPRDVRYRPHQYAYWTSVERYRSGPPYGNAYGHYKKHKADRYDRDDHNGRRGKHKGWKN